MKQGDIEATAVGLFEVSPFVPIQKSGRIDVYALCFPN